MGSHWVIQHWRQPSWLVRHREVSCIAHALYEQHGRVHGHDVDDWLKAEALFHEVPKLLTQVIAVASSERTRA